MLGMSMTKPAMLMLRIPAWGLAVYVGMLRVQLAPPPPPPPLLLLLLLLLLAREYETAA